MTVIRSRYILLILLLTPLRYTLPPVKLRLYVVLQNDRIEATIQSGTLMRLRDRLTGQVLVSMDPADAGRVTDFDLRGSRPSSMQDFRPADHRLCGCPYPIPRWNSA